jgi:hypothetical protein
MKQMTHSKKTKPPNNNKPTILTFLSSYVCRFLQLVGRQKELLAVLLATIICRRRGSKV